MSSIQERIKYICESIYKGNINSAALAFGMAPNTLRGLTGILQRGGELQDPKYEQLMKIFKATGVSLDWLMLGAGEMNETVDDQEPVAPEISTLSNNDDNDSARLRAQNDRLANDVSSLIAQNRALVETNARLTERLITSDNRAQSSMLAMDMEGHSYNKKE